MKKPYFLFAAVLVVLILAFTVSRGYLESLEKEAKSNASQAVQKSELDRFKIEVEKRIDETESAFLTRLDSLEQKFRDSQTPDTVAAPVVVEIPAKAAEVAKKPEPKPAVVTPVSGPNAPSDRENEIYLKYLKRRWALPGDLTNDELKLAKDEIMQNVGRQYSMTAEEVLQLIDRVYEYRKAKKQK